MATRKLDIQIIRPLIKPRISTTIVVLIVSVAMMFVPEFLSLGSGKEVESVDFVVMEGYVLFSYSALVAKIVQLVVLFVLSLSLIYVCNRQQVLPLKSALPLIVGMMVFSGVDYFHYFDNGSAAFVVFFLIFRQILLMYHRDTFSTIGFNIGMLSAICVGLKTEYALFLLPMVLVGFYLYSAMTVRVILAFVMGVVLVFFVMFSGYYLIEGEMFYIPELFANIEFFNVELLNYSTTDVAFISLMGVAAVWGLVTYFRVNANQKISVRLNLTYILVVMVLSVIWIVCISPVSPTLVLVPSVFIVLLLSLYFSANSSNMSTNVAFLLFVGLCVVYRVLWVIGV